MCSSKVQPNHQGRNTSLTGLHPLLHSLIVSSWSHYSALIVTGAREGKRQASGSSLTGCFFATEAVAPVPTAPDKRNSCATERTRWLSGQTSPLCFHLTCKQIVSVPSCRLRCLSLQITPGTLRGGNSPFSLSSLKKGAGCLHVVQWKVIMSCCHISFQRFIYLVSFSSTALLPAVWVWAESNQRLYGWIRAISAPVQTEQSQEERLITSSIGIVHKCAFAMP